MTSIFINIFTIAVTLVLLFIMSILPVRKKERTNYLTLLFAALLVHLGSELLYLIGAFEPVEYSVLSVSAVLIFGPTLYFHARELSGLSTRNFLVHIIPYQIGAITIWILLFSNAWRVPQWFLSGYYGSILFIYFLLTLDIRIKKPLTKHSSWVKSIEIGFGILVMLLLSEILWLNFFKTSKYIAIQYFNSGLDIYSILFMTLVLKQIITKPTLFSKVQLRRPYKHDNSPINPTQLQLITRYVTEDKSFKNSNLNRETIANSTGLSINQVSEIINTSFKKNFNDWINDLRIEEAKHYLKESELSIKEIYYEVGFNSKSAFNSAFKKRLGTTPSSYRSTL
ncbi:helix-turn-helix domain-containing protein [Flagellimonas flava]|uniref:helix-turn-helix domain-containing protein n=1 Tax=Flagellimonas flava TaxID=570519 RepID=UPI003D65926C